MEQTCARAVELGLRSVAFTDHADFTGWYVGPDSAFPSGPLRAYVDDDHVFVPPPLDLDGYHETIERCRTRFAALDIRSGVELSEPHRHHDAAADLLARGRFDIVVGGVHSLPDGQRFLEAGRSHTVRPAAQVLSDYLTEVAAMVRSDERFDTLAHIDYVARRWPAGVVYRPEDFEEEYRQVLAALAASGRALEVNTRRPLEEQVVRWWHEVGGGAVTFGSDAHDPLAVARGFDDAADMVEAVGYRAGEHRHDFWRRG